MWHSSIKYGFVSLLLVGLFVSCESRKNAEELVTLKVLQKDLHQSIAAMEALDTLELHRMRDDIKVNVKFVNDNDELFIMDSAFVRFFGLYSATGKMLSRMLRKDFRKLRTDMLASKVQIKYLRHDLKHQLLPADSVDYFIQREHEMARDLIQSESHLTETVKLQYEAYQITKEPMTRYINRVKNIMYFD